MSKLHGTLDKCAECPVKDLCVIQDDIECDHCKYKSTKNLCGKTYPGCVNETVCNFTPIPTDQPLTDPT